MRIGLEVDAGNYATRHREALATDGVADDADLRFKLWDVAKSEGWERFEILKILH